MFRWLIQKLVPVGNDTDPSRAVYFLRRGEFGEALRRADIILAVDRRIALSWRFKGECLFQMNRFTEAEACFREAHTLGGPGIEEVLLWAALCQHNVGQRSSAVMTLQDYIASLPSEAIERRNQAERALVVIQSPAPDRSIATP